MGWLAGWAYRKEITVTNASADFSSFILVGKTSDAVGEDVDCEGHCLDNFYDLRFTELDGTTLIPHWRESVVDSGGTKLASIAFKNNADPETTLFMYYGKADAPDVSSIADTFIKGDDFERGNNQDAIGGDWTVATAPVEISTDFAYGGTRCAKWVTHAETTREATIPVTAGSGIAIRFRYYRDDAAPRFYFNHGDGSTVAYPYINDTEDVLYWDTESRDTGDDVTAGAWQLLELNNFDWAGNTFDIWLNGAKIQDNAAEYSSALYTDILNIRIAGAVVGNDNYIDDLIIRKWAATEPSFAWGSEETEIVAVPRHGFVNFQDPGIV